MFVACQKNEIPQIKHGEHGGKIMNEIKEFMESGLPAAEYIIPDGRSALHVQNSFRVCIKRHNYPVGITIRNGRVFLLKKEG